MWTEKFFNKMYWELFMKRTPDEALQQAHLINQAYLLYKSNLPQNVLDVCCGVGDILEQLAQLNKNSYYGIEYSDEYVEISKSFMNIKVIQQDAFSIRDWTDISKQPFDLIYNWYSSFAYFTPGKNLQMIKNSFNALNNGGLFMIEAYNSYDVLMKFSKEFKYEKKYHGVNYKINRQCHIDHQTRMLEQKWIFQPENSDSFSYDTQSFLYLPDEVIQMLTMVGFTNIMIKTVNNSGLSDFSFESPRWIIIAEK